LVGIKLDNLTDNEFNQISMFDQPVRKEKNSKLDSVIDKIKDKYGYNSITLGTIINTETKKD